MDLNFSWDFSTPEIYCLGILILIWIIEIIYQFYLFNRPFRFYQKEKNGKIEYTHQYPAVSVIVYAQNDAENLVKYMPKILNQAYPEFEVIVVNDDSTDDSKDILSVLETQYKNLYHTYVPEGSRNLSHKKLALTLGIKAARYNIVVFTNANCDPRNNEWLATIARNFVPGIDIVLGYTAIERKEKEKLSFWYCSYDQLLFSIRYLSFALINRPYMGVSSNMAYRKELFFKQKGYSKYLNLQRGEDDLFINQIVTKTNTRVETDFNATMRIQPVYRYKNWKEEKISYMATARFYRGAQRYLSGFETFSRLLFYVACMAGIVFGILNFHWLVAGIALLIWLLRYITQAIVINRTAKEMGGGRKYYFSLPIFDILQPIQSLNFKLCRLFRGKGDFMRR